MSTSRPGKLEGTMELMRSAEDFLGFRMLAARYKRDGPWHGIGVGPGQEWMLNGPGFETPEAAVTAVRAAVEKGVAAGNGTFDRRVLL